MVEKIFDNSDVIAIIIRDQFQADGIQFFTPDDYSQQLAYMKHPKGKQIEPHVHNLFPRQVMYTNEVLFIKQGKLRVDFFNDAKAYLESRILEKGDVILLVRGGHGFEVLEDLVMLEVKQGPYAGEGDKTRFKPDFNEIKLIK